LIYSNIFQGNNQDRKLKISQNSFTIILVHGYTNNPSDFDLWVEVLEQEELQVLTVPYYKKDTIYEPIEKYVQFIADFIANEQFSNDLILIGFSMGGLVVRYYLHNLYEKETLIKKVITIATPHHGSDLATWGTIGGVIGDLISKLLAGKTLLKKPVVNTSIVQLTPYSPFITKLNNCTSKIQTIYREIPFLNIWLKNDLVIVPAGNAIVPFKNIINREISGDLIHNHVLKEKGVQEVLKKEIIPILKHQKQQRRKGPQSQQQWKDQQLKEKMN